MQSGFAPMGDVSSAPRDEPSTCQALRAQRRPRGAARTRGHGEETPANRCNNAVATVCTTRAQATMMHGALFLERVRPHGPVTVRGLVMAKPEPADRRSRSEIRKEVKT